jgi:hypothetical protein
VRPRHDDPLVDVGLEMQRDELADLPERALIIGLDEDGETGLVGPEGAARPTELDGPVGLVPVDPDVGIRPLLRALLELPAQVGEILCPVLGRDVCL